MTLTQISLGYQGAAEALRPAIGRRRRALRETDCPRRRQELRYEIAVLNRILKQCVELGELTAHYYERGYPRNGKYTL